MHGRVHRGGRSCRSLERSCGQHMRSVLPLATTNDAVVLAGDSHTHRDSSITTSINSDSFFKGGRKIRVGDCALFKPQKDSPPFIGLIRWLALDKENNLQLGVNWLYRSSELKLGKGTLLDSAPNEIFYSFQKDEVPAASLLHPCKVAFLPRSVELPIGTSSFICRRAYDIANKSLSWLTDLQLVNDQQEEVDQLLFKTRSEMHQTLQPGARSPKQNNGPTSTSQLKQGSDNGPNSANAPSQAKGKKRERGDHGSDTVKRGRSARPDDGDSVQSKTESDLKHEIAKITEKAGVVDLDGVEKLVQLMQLDTPERKLDLGSRSMLAYVLASIDNVDCLSRFVHLRGLPVLDSWLQDIHKGKIGDGNNSKDGDKSVEEFLLILLRALGKIPVNLQALQTCNIGKSVNHLRSHKNMEIQRKARTLVDTWKKRVEAEMINIDVQSGSTQGGSPWPSKSRLPEASHGGNRTPDGAMKSSLTQNSSAKTSSGRSSPGESGNKHASSSLGPVKPAPTLASGKESQLRGSGRGTVDAPQIREDRNSSSNQSHNNGQSLSVKDDIESSASLAATANKTLSTSTRNRKHTGFPGASASTGQKETSSSRSSPVHKNTALEKSSYPATTGERIVEGPISEGISHKLIVKIPNRVRSPAQGVCGDSLEDPMIMSSHASPVKKHKQSDTSSKDKGETNDVNNDQEHSSTGSECAGSPAVPPEDGQSMATDASKRLNEVPASDKLKSIKSQASSFSPMNALVESCAKYSEATSSLSLDDDGGMNLLASVAAGEISRSDVSPNDSIERATAAVEEVCSGVETKSKSSSKDYSAGVQNEVYNDGCDGKKQAVLNCCSGPDAFSSGSKDIDSSFMKLRSNTDPKSGIGGMMTEEKDNTNLVSGDCKLISGDTVSKALEEGNSNKYKDEGLNMASVSLLKQTSTVAEPVFADKASNKCLDQLEFGQKSVPEAGVLAKVVELGEKDAVGKSERVKSDNDLETSHDLNSRCELASLEHQEIAEHSLPESQCPGSMRHEAQKDELCENRSASTSKHDRSNTGKSASTGTGSACSTYSGAAEPCEKMKFDLNEGFSDDDGKYEESVTLSSTVQNVKSLPSPLSSIPLGYSASITVASAAKGNFSPPDDLLRSKVELGWKGSAATSAFRPAEPRKVVETAVGTSNSSYADASTSKHDRFPLDIDLNVPDERVLEELASRGSALAFESTTHPSSNCASLLSEASGSMQRSSGVLDLDLNRADEANDIVHFSTSSNHHVETPFAHVKPVSNLHIQRDFDLNNGPTIDDASVRQFSVSHSVKGGAAAQLPSAGLTMSNQGPNSFTSWFSPGNTYSTVAIPSVLPDRGEHSFSVFPPGAPQRSFGPGGVAQFNRDVYRGSVLSSSPAVPYPSGPFQYPVFSFGATFPLPSGTFSVGGNSYPDSSSGARIFPPSMNSQYLGPDGNVVPQFQRPFMVGLPDVNNNGVLDSNRKWNRQGLDLNAGPGAIEGEVKEENLPHLSGQQSVSSFQALAEEQSRMFSVSGGILKRREPDGGWDNEPARRRHSSWQ
ncbi:BAH domain [Striga asiatica]|uniref:BAH domain n=1 Tax=Striga asiatica TaxID=4170 RepID=A0A5A7P2M8_STRAF|nr:BAH domain [Striga asiatica]